MINQAQKNAEGSRKVSVIEVENISKTFMIPREKSTTLKGAFVNAWKFAGHHLFHALDQVSFSVTKGECFGIVGKNGSGKSTLLKILAGVYVPDSGSIRITGGISPFLELGIGFNPELSGRDNLYLNAAVLGLSKKQINERFDAIVDFSEIGKFIDQKLKNYSSGMQVRLAFSIAIHANRETLLLDEVFAVGDAAFQKKSLAQFDRLRREGKTIILVTHDPEIIKNHCDRVLLLKNGRVEALGNPKEIMEYYQNSVDEIIHEPVEVHDIVHAGNEGDIQDTRGVLETLTQSFDHVVFLINKGIRALRMHGFKEMMFRARRYIGGSMQYREVSSPNNHIQSEIQRLKNFLGKHRDKKKILFFSTNTGWGGSEVGCAKMAQGFAEDGWAVMLCMAQQPVQPKVITDMIATEGLFVFERAKDVLWPDGTMNVIASFSPDIVFISQGHLFESVDCMKWCHREGFPYVNFIPLAEKIHTSFIPNNKYRDDTKRLLDTSRMIFLDNHQAERNIKEVFGSMSTPFHVVYNYDVALQQPKIWREVADGENYQLIVLGRLDMFHKGLDMLLEVLAKDKWRKRPLEFLWYGSGSDEENIRTLIKNNNMHNVRLCGPTTNQAEVLLKSHGLVFASRMEGTPLALIEAMLCYRVPMVTPVGGMPEMIQDGQDGFLASDATVQAIDEMLERAWNKRCEWKDMGLKAGTSIREKVVEKPFKTCSDIVKKMLD